jgi:cell division protein FtsQ
VKEKTKNIILCILIWLCVAILGGYLIFAIVMFGKKEEKFTCTSINIHINNDYGYMNTSDVYQVLGNNNLNPIGSVLTHNLINQIESALYTINVSKNIECYAGDSILYIEIEQRKPYFRVFSRNDSYYIDTERKLINTSSKFSADVPLVIGHFDKIEATNEVYDLVKFLQEDKYWQSLFKQIYITKDKKITLISSEGVQEINLGGFEDYQTQLISLKKWYEQYPERNCDTLYSRINLQYDSLIYCTKKTK